MAKDHGTYYLFSTGKPATSSPAVYSIASKPSPDPEEGAGIVYHDGYYYLFVSVGYCCRGISSTYHIQVGRSASVTGQRRRYGCTGHRLRHDRSWRGVRLPGKRQRRPRYHYYDAYANGDAWVQIRPLIWVNVAGHW